MAQMPKGRARSASVFGGAFDETMQRQGPGGQRAIATTGPRSSLGAPSFTPTGRLEFLRLTPAGNNTVTRDGRTYKRFDNGRASVLVPTLDPSISQAEVAANRAAIDRALFMASNPLAGAAYGVASLTGASPKQRDLALAVGGTADAVIGSSAPRPSRVHYPGPASKAVPQIPRDGSVRYRPTNTSGQSQGMVAVLMKPMLGTGSGTKRRVKPPGFVSGEGPYYHDRGHLLGRQLGGHADTLEEVFTAQRNPTNGRWMRSVEDEVKRRVDSGEMVDYSVTPLYTSGVAAPKAIALKAIGDRGLAIVKVIGNRPKSPSDDD